MIASGTLVLIAYSGRMSASLTTTMRGLIANSYQIGLDGPALPGLFEKIGLELIAALAIPFLPLMQRLFSMQALTNLAKGVKIMLTGAVLTAPMWPERLRLIALTRGDLADVLRLTLSLTLKLLGAVVAMMAIVAAADYLFQYRLWYEKQKMLLREMKEEFKQSEDDRGQAEADVPYPHAQAHDRGGSEGGGGDHKPDPLRRRPAI